MTEFLVLFVGVAIVSFFVTLPFALLLWRFRR